VIRSVASGQRQEASAARLMTLLSIGAEMRHQLDQPSLFRLVLNTVGVLFNANTALILGADARGDRFQVLEGFGVSQTRGLGAMERAAASGSAGQRGRGAEPRRVRVAG
jgi:hypothetical protein